MRFRQLAAFLIDFMEKPGVLHGENRLMGKGLHRANRIRRQSPGRFALNNQCAKNLVLARERNNEY